MFLKALLFSTLAYAEPAQFTILGENEPAPFEGVLFNEFAISTVLSDYEIAAYSCDIRTDYELKKLQEKYNFEFENLKIEHNSLINEYDLFIMQKDREINSLTTALKKTSPRYKWLWFAGGIRIGGASSYGVYKLYNEK